MQKQDRKKDSTHYPFNGCIINSVGGNTSILSFIYKKT